LEAERQRKAAEEARRRAEAEERERSRRLEALRSEVSKEVSSAERALKRRQSDLPAAEFAPLTKEVARLNAQVGNARSEAALRDVQQALVTVEQRTERQAAAEAARRAEILRRKAAGEAAAGELGALIEGLKADPVVMRWQYHRMAEVESPAAEARKALSAENWDAPAALLEQARARASSLVEAANAAQLKADTRDYIARSIVAALTGMGYVVSEPQASHADHPASDLTFRAADASGRSVAVSVPVEGEVYYTVDGFAHTTEPLAEGGAAPACDQAEAVLDQMRGRLADEYGVDAGEIRWDGKADPNRRLRQADELPQSGEQRHQGR
jgi:hypothetical protein